MLRKILKYIFWLTGTAFVGIFASYGVWTLGDLAFSKPLSYCSEGECLAAQTDSAELAVKPKTLYKISGTSSYFVKDKNQKIKLSAEAFLVGDIDTGEIIFSRNRDARYPIASVSKLITALVARDKINATDLLYPLLLQSSNRVADDLAEAAGFSDFIRLMNDQALAVGMSNTIFEEPSGLSAQNLSTAGDLFRLAGYLGQERPDILKITLKNKEEALGQTWFNNSRFLYGYGYLGGKTGYTNAAKYTLLSIFEVKIAKQKRNIAIILLQSADRQGDVNRILNYLRSNAVYQASKTALNPVSTPGVELLAVASNLIKEEPKKTILMFGGDLMLDRGVKRSIYRDFGGDYNNFLENLSFFRTADIAFANLEGNLSDRGQDTGKKYSFRMEPEALEAISSVGLNALSVANNHTGDWGQSAFVDTVKRLKEKNIAPVGGDLSRAEAEKPKIIEKNGLKIGLLGFTDVGPNWLESKNVEPGLPAQAGILIASDPRFSEIISKAKEQVDFLIVSFHWGEEYQKPTERQKTLARTAIDSGADIIAGHHPHVTQTTEMYKDKLIIYSLGNLVFDQYFSEATMQGLIVKVTLEDKNISQIEKNIIKLARNYQPIELVPYSDNILNLKASALSGESPGISNACPKPKKEFPDQSLFNVNQENSLGDYVPKDLVVLSKNITNGLFFCLEKETSEALNRMLKAAESEDLIIAVTSAYRSPETQEDLHKNSTTRNDGLFPLVALAEHSEHQLGTTVDLSGHSLAYEKTTFQFENSPEYTWMEENAHKFGFILSYPKNKELITGYRYEPWHWRYVGLDLAQEIKNSGLTITEFLSDHPTEIGG